MRWMYWELASWMSLTLLLPCHTIQANAMSPTREAIFLPRWKENLWKSLLQRLLVLLRLALYAFQTVRATQNVGSCRRLDNQPHVIFSRLQADSECHPLEEQSGGRSEVNPQSKNVHSSITIGDMSKCLILAKVWESLPFFTPLNSYTLQSVYWFNHYRFCMLHF